MPDTDTRIYEFDFGTPPEDTKWLVQNLIPLGHLCIVLAQAGVGKSLVVEDLGVHIVYEVPFCGFDTIFGDVLIIDQDTPTDVLKKRLIRFGQGTGKERKHKLFVQSMNGFSLDDKSLITVINDFPTAKLVIIDSLHSVCGKLNPNITSDMSRLAHLKQVCLDLNKTIIINHHISEKREFTPQELMAGDAHNFAMGSSAIIQQADTYYAIGAKAKDGRTEKIFMRTISKRASVSAKPLVLRIVNGETGGETIEYEGEFEADLTVGELDVLTLFKETPGIERTVKEVYDAMGHKHGENTIRESLANLETTGRLLMSRNRSNLFKYKLSPAVKH